MTISNICIHLVSNCTCLRCWAYRYTNPNVISTILSPPELHLSTSCPLLFILVPEALSHEFRTGVPWEPLYADDLAVIGDTLEECVSKLKAWKEGMENKGLRVNMKKTKLMVTGPGLDVLLDSGAFSCAVYRDGVGLSNAL